MKITDRVCLVGSGETGVYISDCLDCNCYLVDCSEGYVLIDTGLGVHPEQIDAHIAAGNADGKRLLAILLTHAHADHEGGAYYFRAKYGAPVCAPRQEADIVRTGDEARSGLDVARKAGFYPADYAMIPCEVDRELSVGEHFHIGDVEWRAFEAKGHSIGGLCYLAEIGGRRLLFAGDLVAFGGKISLQNIPGADVHAYARSIHGISGLSVDELYPGHGLFVLKNGQSHIDSADAAFGKLFVPV